MRCRRPQRRGSPRPALLAQNSTETRSTRLDSHDFPAVEIGYGATLIPQTVIDEAVEWNGTGKVNTACLPKVVKREGWSRRGDVTSRHPERNNIPLAFGLPKCHGFAERMHVRPFTVSKLAEADSP